MLIVNHNLVDIIKVIKPNLETGPWIAGGAVRLWFTRSFTHNHDIDVFFKDEKQFLSIKNILNHSNEYSLLYTSDNALTYTIHTEVEREKYLRDLSTDKHTKIKKIARYIETQQVQLIRNKFYQSAYDVINGFDITVCQFVTDGRKIIYGKHALNDLHTKTLRFNNYNPNALKRYIKYRSYGFRDRTNELKKLLSTLNNHEFSADDY